MKSILSTLSLIFAIAISVTAQESRDRQATTDDGQKVILYSNGTWKASDAPGFKTLTSEDKYVGLWTPLKGGAEFSIRKEGEIYILEGATFDILTFSMSNGILKSNAGKGDVKYDEDKGHLFFQNKEYLLK